MLFFSRGICCSARVCAHFVVGCVGSYGVVLGGGGFMCVGLALDGFWCRHEVLVSKVHSKGLQSLSLETVKRPLRQSYRTFKTMMPCTAQKDPATNTVCVCVPESPDMITYRFSSGRQWGVKCRRLQSRYRKRLPHCYLRLVVHAVHHLTVEALNSRTLNSAALADSFL